MTVHITFQIPARPDRPDSPTVHERTLEGVPQAVAEKILEDFRAYEDQSFEGRSSTAGQWKVYQYQKLGEESRGVITVPLDYSEVIDVEVAEAR